MEQTNEQHMKTRGESRVWNSILTKQNKSKKISATQVGQQIIFGDALNILTGTREWINEGSASTYRKELKEYFYDDEILLQKITESLLLLASSSYIELGHSSSTKRINTRHRKIVTVQKKVMPELSFDHVWRFLEIIIDASAYFTVEKNLVYNKNKALWNVKYACTLSEAILHKLTIEAHSAFFPGPMLTPPLDWSYEGGVLVGGYQTYQYDMIRAGFEKIDYSLYSKQVFESVNYIQALPWRINANLLEAIQRDLKTPEKGDFVKTEYPSHEKAKWDIDINSKAIKINKIEIEKIKEARAEFSKKVELYKAEAGDFESAMGKYRAVKLALGVAEDLKDEENLYFPHNYDFRGRVYPIPVGLSPQGSDVVKSMLEYSNGQKLTKRGLQWCWAYMASLYGEDKIAFLDRVKLGKDLISADYKQADEPYQFLAHQLEMKKFLEDPDYKIKTRIHLDACNSGSQFTSAITGDEAGCIATNVIPTVGEDGKQDRQDAYLLVGNKSLKLTKQLIKLGGDNDHIEELKFFQQLLKDEARNLCKRPVMVSNYGGTSGGRAEIIWDMLRELDVERKWITKKNASLFSRIIGQSIVGVLNGGKAFETYIHQMNNVLARKNRPVVWTTSDGFTVTHKKYRESKKQIVCLLPNSRSKTTINKKIFMDKLSPVKMKSAISPNYIHSLDAELLRRVALRLRDIGIKDSDWIHDSFGCHPNHVDQLLHITKDEFRLLVRRCPLENLDAELRSQADDSRATKRELSRISIPDLDEGAAKIGKLDVVMDSNWFFS